MLWRILYIASVGLFAVFAPSIVTSKSRRFFAVFALISGLLAAVLAAPSAFFNFGLFGPQPVEAIGGMLGALLGFGLPVWGTAVTAMALRALDTSPRVQHLGAVVAAALLIPIALPLAFALTVMLTAN
jgi:hypothetical protein